MLRESPATAREFNGFLASEPNETDQVGDTCDQNRADFPGDFHENKTSETKTNRTAGTGHAATGGPLVKEDAECMQPYGAGDQDDDQTCCDSRPESPAKRELQDAEDTR